MPGKEEKKEDPNSTNTEVKKEVKTEKKPRADPVKNDDNMKVEGTKTASDTSKTEEEVATTKVEEEKEEGR